MKRYSTSQTAIFISDLVRPETEQSAKLLLEQYATNEPEILRRDFFNSLLAAFSIEEVQLQLKEAQLKSLCVEQISDRHMLVHGYIT